MTDCVFCRIISGDLPGRIVYEDEHTAAFMDTAGDVDGHMLVIPKKHCRNIPDCDPDTFNAVMRTVRNISVHLTKNCGYDGINLLHASGESAGQSVPHFHIHLIPRKQGDQVNAWPVFEGAKQDIGTLFSSIKMEQDSL